MDLTLNIGSVVLNIVDIIILAVAFIAGIAGAFEGFAKSFASKAAVLVGLIVGLMFTELAMTYVFDRFGLPPVLNSLFSYMLCFIVGYALTLMLGNMLSAVFEGVGLSVINSFLGFVWGVAFIFVISAVILMLLSYQNVFDLTTLINDSYLFQNIFTSIIPVAEGFLKNV